MTISLVTSFGAEAPGIKTAPITTSLFATEFDRFTSFECKRFTLYPKISSNWESLLAWVDFAYSLYLCYEFISFLVGEESAGYSQAQAGLALYWYYCLWLARKNVSHKYWVYLAVGVLLVLNILAIIYLLPIIIKFFTSKKPRYLLPTKSDKMQYFT